MVGEPQTTPVGPLKLARAPRLGRALVWVGGTSSALEIIAMILLFGRAFRHPGVSVPLVVLVVGSWATGFGVLWGYRLTGRPQASWEPLLWQPLTVVFRIGITVVIAGYAYYVEHGVLLAYRWIPTEAYHGLDRFLPTGVAIAASIPVWVAWTIVVLASATLIKEPLKLLVGPNTTTAAWIDDTFGGFTNTEGKQGPES